MRTVSVFLASMLAVNAVPALAGKDKNAPIVLEPSSPWNVDFGDEKCRLARMFGEGEDRHLLFIEQGGPGPRFVLMAIGPAFDSFRRPDRISIRFEDFPWDEQRKPMLGETKGIGASLIFTQLSFEDFSDPENEAKEQPRSEGLPRMDAELASAINSITLRYRDQLVVFRTGNIGDAIKVMNDCALNFVEVWGLDRGAHESMVQPPKWKNERAVARRIQATYPSNALRRGEGGIIRLRVTVEEDGSISDCILNKATIADSLDSPACREMRKAQFEPALDKDGKAMRSFYTTNIVYRIGR